MYQITDKKILENWGNEKFLKKDMRKVKKEIYKDFELTPRGYKEIDIMARKTDDAYFLCNIGQWPEEREENTYDYDIYIFDKNGKLIYDEANGELRKFKCYERFNNIKRTTYEDFFKGDDCKKRCKCEECELCYSSPMLVRDDRWNTSTWPDQIEIDGFKCGATGRYALDVKQLKKSSLDDDEILFTQNEKLTRNIFSRFGVVIK